MPRPRTDARSPGPSELLDEAEVQSLLLAASERAPTGVRNRALVALLYCSGLRLEEALALAPEDCVPGSDTLRVRGRRARRAHLFAAAQPYLQTWRACRAARGLAACEHLFCTLAGEPLKPAYVRAMLARLARRAGLPKRVHAHLLRHSCAARLARAGLAAEELAAQLGQHAGRGSVRALARFGVALAARGRGTLAATPWSLAPEPGAVRAIVRAPSTRIVAPAPAESAPGAGIRVRRWLPEEL